VKDLEIMAFRFSLLSDREIPELCQGERPMISPVVPRQEGGPSYGLSSFGYDIRLGRRFLVPLGGVNAILKEAGGLYQDQPGVTFPSYDE